MPGTEPTNRSLKYLFFTAERYRDYKALKKNIFEDPSNDCYFWRTFDRGRFYSRDRDIEGQLNDQSNHRVYTIVLTYSTRASIPRLSSVSQAEVDQRISGLRAWGRAIGLRWNNVEDDKLVFKLEGGQYFNTPRAQGDSSSSTSRSGSS